MKTFTISNSGRLALAIAGLSLAFAGGAKADCSVKGDGPATVPQHAAMGSGQGAFRLVADRDDNVVGGSIVGLWNTTFTSGGQVVDQGFDQWNSDGTEILNDDPAPSTGNVCLGVYVRTGPATYKVKHPSWTFDSAGNLTGTAIIREVVTVAPNGNSYKGTFSVELLDLSNNKIATFSGTIAATRITVDF